MPAVTLTAWMLAIGAALLHAGSLARGEVQAVPATPSFLALVGYLGVVPSGVGFALYFSLLERAGALQANLVVYVVPVVAVLIGWAWLGETLSPLTLVGFGVVFLGFVVVKYGECARMVAAGWRALAGGRTGPHR